MSMELELREIMVQQAAEEMAKALLASEGKELKSVQRLVLDGKTKMPQGVYGTLPGRYAINTPDGATEVKKGDYIVQTLDNKFYYLRFEAKE